MPIAAQAMITLQTPIGGGELPRLLGRQEGEGVHQPGRLVMEPSGVRPGRDAPHAAAAGVD